MKNFYEKSIYKESIKRHTQKTQELIDIIETISNWDIRKRERKNKIKQITNVQNFINSLTQEEIVRNKNKTITDKFEGIYFLIENNEIIYVGQSTDIVKRIYAHSEKFILEKWNMFDAYSIIQMPNSTKEARLFLEEHLIKKFRPKYNIQYKKDNGEEIIDWWLLPQEQKQNEKM